MMILQAVIRQQCNRSSSSSSSSGILLIRRRRSLLYDSFVRRNFQRSTSQNENVIAASSNNTTGATDKEGNNINSNNMKQVENNKTSTDLLSMCQRARELAAVSSVNEAADLLLSVKLQPQLDYDSSSILASNNKTTKNVIALTDVSVNKPCTPKETIMVLHRALLTTAAACIPTNAEKALQLAVFSERIGLPLTYPLYYAIASKIAQEVEESGFDATRIFQLTDSLKRIGGDVSIELFDQVLFTSLSDETNGTQTTLKLIKRMKSKYELFVTPIIATRLLNLVKDKVTLGFVVPTSKPLPSLRSRLRRQKNRTNRKASRRIKKENDELELCIELLEVLDSLMHDEEKLSTLGKDVIKEMDDAMGADGDEDEEITDEYIFGLNIEEDEYDSDDSVGGYDDDDDDDIDYWNTEDSDLEGRTSNIDNSVTNSLTKEFLKYEADYRRDMIYMRELNSSWSIPDMVQQIKDANNGKEIRFTEEYEKDLWEEMLDEFGPYPRDP